MEATVRTEPLTREEARQERFFDRLESVLPKGAVLICASGSFGKGGNKAMFRYRHCGREYQTTLITEGLS